MDRAHRLGKPISAFSDGFGIGAGEGTIGAERDRRF